MIKVFRIAVVTLLAYVIVGCASFHNEELVVIEKMPDISSFENKPKVYIDLKFFMGHPDDGNATEISQAKEKVQPVLDKYLKDSGLFGEYTFDQFEQENMGYTLQLHFYNHGNIGAAAVSGFITGFTFGVIPGAATDNFTLKSKLNNSSDIMHSYENTDSMTTWIGLWFIPMMGNDPTSTSQDILLNQIKTVLAEMIDKEQLKYSWFGITADTKNI